MLCHLMLTWPLITQVHLRTDEDRPWSNRQSRMTMTDWRGMVTEGKLVDYEMRNILKVAEYHFLDHSHSLREGIQRDSQV